MNWALTPLPSEAMVGTNTVRLDHYIALLGYSTFLDQQRGSEG